MIRLTKALLCSEQSILELSHANRTTTDTLYSNSSGPQRTIYIVLISLAK